MTDLFALVAYSPSTLVGLNSGALNIQLAEQTVFAITALPRLSEVSAVFVSMNNCTPGALITVRTYRSINGVERRIDNFTVTQGVDPDEIAVMPIWLALEPTGAGINAFRVSMQSNNPADAAVIVPYSYVIRKLPV